MNNRDLQIIELCCAIYFYWIFPKGHSENFHWERVWTTLLAVSNSGGLGVGPWAMFGYNIKNRYSTIANIVKKTIYDMVYLYNYISIWIILLYWMDKPLEHCELHYFNTILRPVRGFKRCTEGVYFQLSNEHVCTITHSCRKVKYGQGAWPQFTLN